MIFIFYFKLLYIKLELYEYIIFLKIMFLFNVLYYFDIWLYMDLFCLYVVYDDFMNICINCCDKDKILFWFLYWYV